MSDPIAPPPAYVAYPRASDQDPSRIPRIEALIDAYFGLNWVFLVNLVFAIGMAVARDVSWALMGAIVVATFLVVAIMTYPKAKRMAFGMGWSEGSAVVAAVLVGLNSALFCGIIGYAVLQMLALNRMRFLGYPRGTLWTKKSALRKLDALRGQDAVGGPAVPR